MVFGSILPEIWTSRRAIKQVKKSGAWQEEAWDFGASKNIGTFLPKSCGVLPAVSTTLPDKEKKITV
jgi:hypothetical protein